MAKARAGVEPSPGSAMLASMYKMFLPICEKMYLTHINAEENAADVYFPEFSEFDWQTKVVHEGEDNGISYKMVEYTRKK